MTGPGVGLTDVEGLNPPPALVDASATVDGDVVLVLEITS